MTRKQFKKKLTQLIENNNFIVDDNTYDDFKFLTDEQIIVSGKDHTEVFHITILKV